jgi:zinc transport system substrate-binding protein
MKIRNKILVALAILLAAYLVLEKMALPGNAPTRPTTENGSPQIQTSVSFYPLAYLVEQIAGKNAHLITITPAGMEPHDFEPSPTDIAKIYGSKIFIFNGNGLEPWAEKIAGDVSKEQNTSVIKLSDYLASITEPTIGADPHFWLDPNNMSLAADKITQAFVDKDNTNAQYYMANRDSLKEKLTQLDQAFATGLANCTNREIITTHDAFGYMAKRYNFTTFHILGFSPDEDPSPKTIASISTLAKKKNAQYIFFENAASPKLAQTIAQEVGAQTLVLNPIESLNETERAENQDYLSLMNINLQNLRTAMICK